MDTDDRQQRQANWTRHWRSGATHSCAGSYADTYGGAIADFWREVHAGTAPGARALDIASGNGALPRLLLQVRPDLVWHITAVDLAQAPPAWMQALPSTQAERLAFQSGVAAETLPFQDGQFDLILSQYGLEYSDLTLSVPDLLRVRAPGGRVACVLHHAASRPVTLAATEMAHIDWLRGPSGLLTIARRMLPLIALASSDAGRQRLQRDPEAHNVREAFNAAQDALTARSRTPDGADVLGEVQDAVAGLLPLAARDGAARADQAWQGVDQALADARWRLHDLREAALDADAAEALCRTLQAAGLRPRLGTIVDQGHLMGWTLFAD